MANREVPMNELERASPHAQHLAKRREQYAARKAADTASSFPVVETPPASELPPPYAGKGPTSGGGE